MMSDDKRNNTCTGPIKDVQSMLSWNAPPSTYEPFVLPIRVSRRSRGNNRPKTLICHDMKGGYLADKFDFGCKTPDEDGFGFLFWNWLSVDIFVYFSHELITIPPRSWTSIAKANGVKVLGTFITEFDTGERIWKNELGTVEIIDTLVSKMTLVAQHFGFDGWLLNIENKLNHNSAKLAHYLVSKLTSSIHKQIPDGMVIWYDSVVYPDGKLHWQDELNSKNEIFFNSCDGIFLNYTWNLEKLVNSQSLARKANRQFDVYVGVDVFGRNCYGGGGFNTRLAIEQISKMNLSYAIFAFGWVFECLQYNDFLTNQQLFWNLISNFLPYTKNYTVPFSTCFSIGSGTNRWWWGKQCPMEPWYNLSLQSPCHIIENSSTSSMCILVDDDAFIGSSCLKVSLPESFLSVESFYQMTTKLFPLCFPIDGNFLLCVAYKWVNIDENYTACLTISSNQQDRLCAMPLSTGPFNDWILGSSEFSAKSQAAVLNVVINAKADISNYVTTSSPSLLIGYIGILMNHEKQDLIKFVKETVCDYKTFFRIEDN